MKLKKGLNKEIPIIYSLLLFVLHVLPLNSKSELNNFQIIHVRADYFLHILIFVPLPFVLWYTNKYNLSKLKIILILLLAGVAFEFIQYFLPYRSFNINDILANIAGIIVGIVIVNFLPNFNINIKDI